MYLLSYTHMFVQGKSLICEGDQVETGKCYCSDKSSGWVNLLKKIDPANAYSYDKMEAKGGCKRLISHFSELHHQIIWYQTTLKATHGYQSRPWQWFLNWRPVWMYVKYGEGSIANIYNLGNPALFWLGAVTVGISLFSLISFWIAQKRKGLVQLLDLKTTEGKMVFLIVAYFSVWLPWQLSPRIMFFYHYTPAVPLLAINLAYWLTQIYRENSVSSNFIVFASILLIAGCFVIFYPNWTGIPVSQTWADYFYFAIKSWK
jgi:dolichyl-phosphate-mannose-protein mannosyltransferase